MAESAKPPTSFKEGLEDVVATTSSVCFIDGVKGRLLYRGYDIVDLAEHSEFSEVAYLLWYGHLPRKSEYEVFRATFRNEIHLPDETVDALFARMAALTAPGGRTHVLDLVLPARPSPALLLARLDRGDYPRPVAEWAQRFGRHFRIEHQELYPLGLPGVPLWWMIYLVGDPL